MTYSIRYNAKSGKWIVEGNDNGGDWNPCGQYSTRERAIEAATMLGDDYVIIPDAHGKLEAQGK